MILRPSHQSSMKKKPALGVSFDYYYTSVGIHDATTVHTAKNTLPHCQDHPYVHIN
jgi:hypothetical protein